MTGIADPLQFLIAWYRANCDGDWEHQYGIRIDTLDNPGWSLDVDLFNTRYESAVMAMRKIERTDTDWLFVEVKDATFQARGGAVNLIEMMDEFRRFVERCAADGCRKSHTPPDPHYTSMIPQIATHHDSQDPVNSPGPLPRIDSGETYMLEGDVEVKARLARVEESIRAVCDAEEIPWFVSDKATFFDVCSLTAHEIAERLSSHYGRPIVDSELRLPIWQLVDRLNSLSRPDRS